MDTLDVDGAVLLVSIAVEKSECFLGRSLSRRERRLAPLVTGCLTLSRLKHSGPLFLCLQKTTT